MYGLSYLSTQPLRRQPVVTWLVLGSTNILTLLTGQNNRNLGLDHLARE